jgi:DNA helicase-2/ATP-dependent DNA helicase PcrA
VFGAPTFGLPSRFLTEIPAELSEQAESHERSWRTGLDGAPAGFSRAASTARDPALARWVTSGARESFTGANGPTPPSFRLGDDVVHAAFGEGVVTGVEPDGVIVVRFAGDGSERKLMAEYAPVSRR